MADDYTPNTPWVDKILRTHDRELRGVVPPEWVPSPMDRGKYEEYGCGHYGCVLPVPDGRVVLKVTSDPTEAAFVAIYLGLKDNPPGVVRYHQIVQLPEKYRRRPTYAIWRDEAKNVGKANPTWYTWSHRYAAKYGRSMVDFIHNLSLFKSHAGDVRDWLISSKNPRKLLVDAAKLEDWAWKMISDGRMLSLSNSPAQRIAFKRRQLESIAEEMANTHAGYLIGQAFEFYLEQGILLADVHINNVGEVIPPEHESWELVITDPGHMVALDPKWFEIKIPQL